MNQKRRIDARKVLMGAFAAGVSRVLPDGLIRDCVTLDGKRLVLAGTSIDLTRIARIFVVGAGKASGLMALELEQRLGNLVSGGLVSVKHGHAAPCARLTIVEAGHPYPDMAGVMATARIAQLCREATADDLIIVLLSGGGSALLADYPEGSSLEQLAALSRLLLNSGATIQEINAVRKHLSCVKGGQIATLAWPARVVTFILSDVVGDKLDVIASGPTVADPTTFQDAVNVCRSHAVWEGVPEPLRNALLQGVAGRRPETPKLGDPKLSRTCNYLIGTNRMALEASEEYLRSHGISTRIVTDSLEGDSEEAAQRMVEQALLSQRTQGASLPLSLLFGGETTLKVKGKGVGGRNQHLALKAATQLRDHPGITLLAAGTDGTDGPTDAAGAVVDGETCSPAFKADAESSLRGFDSYNFFKRTGGHVITGPTLTNVMDLALVLVE